MNKKLLILILSFTLLFSMACALGRFARGGTSSPSLPIPTWTPENSSSIATEATQPPPATPTKTSLPAQATSTTQPSAGPSSSSVSTSTGIGVPVKCGDLIQIEVRFAPVYFRSLDQLKANGTWLVLHLQLTNLQGETYNYLNENDFTVVGTNSGQTIRVSSTRTADLGAYAVWAYAAYLVDPLLQFGTSNRIVAFDVDPAIKDWTLVFSPKVSPYSTTPFCTAEIVLQ